MRRLGVLAGIVVVACNDPPDFQTIVIDISANCNAVEVDVEASDLDAPGHAWTRVLDAASDGAATTAWWQLVSVSNDNGGQSLQLWHTRDGDVDATVPLGLSPGLADSLSLRPGPLPGEAWLLRREPGMLRVWHVDVHAEAPLMAVSADLGVFPSFNELCADSESGLPEPCDTTEWHRDLMFLGGDPFVVSVAPFSPDASTWVYVGALSTNLSILDRREFEFEARCDPSLPLEEFTLCEDRRADLSHPRVDVLGTRSDPRQGSASVLALRKNAEAGITSFHPDIVLLSLGPTEDGVAAGILRTHEAGNMSPILGPPSGLAVDDFATYVMHATALDGPQLLRVPNLGTTFERIEGIELSDDMSLLQLDGDLALSRIVEGRWAITKLFPDAPEQSQITEHVPSSPVVAVEPAGPGGFILRRQDAGPDLVRIRCTDD